MSDVVVLVYASAEDRDAGLDPLKSVPVASYADVQRVTNDEYRVRGECAFGYLLKGNPVDRDVVRRHFNAPAFPIFLVRDYELGL